MDHQKLSYSESHQLVPLYTGCRIRSTALTELRKGSQRQLARPLDSVAINAPS